MAGTLLFLAGLYPVTIFGGLATAITIMASSSVLWVTSHPGVAEEPLLTQALYRLGFALEARGSRCRSAFS